jgi:hypothetical protein
MITTAERPRNSNAIIVATLVASILVHVSFLFVALLAGSQFPFTLILHVDQITPVPPPPDEVITISKSAFVAPVPKLEHGAHTRVAMRQPDRPAFTDQVPLAFRKTVPIRIPRGAGPRVSQQQVAGFMRAFSHSSAARAADDTRVTADPAAAPKRYRLQLQGKLGHLHHGEGIYYPIRGWRSGGLDYYYVAYQYTHPDGTIESGNVPWPIHFVPNDDPFVSTDIAMLEHTPLPPPPAGFVPPGDLGAALRYYFPNMQFEEEN